ncbi:DsbA family protein [Streptomyces sp. NPDC007088]|uniref:DsbA family protein n=1 Tax=Streptomyces sp. NPDC007088 TaxID=3364773 RepID=UPI0036B791C5
MTSASARNPAGAAVPAHTSGPGHTVVRYGPDTAAHVLSVYEDPRCPYCKRMENGLGAVFQEAADAGRIRVDHHFATFIDENAGGTGSLRALSALGAALDEGSEQFVMYLRVLFAEQPPEDEDLFADTTTLVRLGAEVPGLDTPGFREKVTDGTYLSWARAVSDAFDRSGVRATPTVLLDGEPLTVLGPEGYAVTPEAFEAQLPG